MIKMVLLSFVFCVLADLGAQKIGGQLSPWMPGLMDIHHISTGRGNSAFCILPDGTTLLIDAGDMSETHPRTTSSRNASLVPNSKKTAPGWIVDYIDQFRPREGKRQLDYSLITHYHDDHFGEMDSLRESYKGKYVLTGITAVGSYIPIGKLIDRGHSFPINLKSKSVQNQEVFLKDAFHMLATLRNYWAFIQYQCKKNGLQQESLQVGSTTQIKLDHQPGIYSDFSIFNVASNGIVWTGNNEDSYSIFKYGEYPGENPLSNCIKIRYGLFDYFTGGDIGGIDAFGETDTNSMESHLAPVVGAVDVATLNHHGNRDSQNLFYVRILRPRVWIQQNWSADHPGEEVFRRISSTKLYPGERDIFSTVMLDGAKEVIGEKLDQYKSQHGHIVIRVHPRGERYEVIILNDKTTTREIVSIHGPYHAR